MYVRVLLSAFSHESIFEVVRVLLLIARFISVGYQYSNDRYKLQKNSAYRISLLMRLKKKMNRNKVRKMMLTLNKKQALKMISILFGTANHRSIRMTGNHRKQGSLGKSKMKKNLSKRKNDFPEKLILIYLRKKSQTSISLICKKVKM